MGDEEEENVAENESVAPRRLRQPHPITPAVYKLLTLAFKADPGNFKAASLAAGCAWRTARRAWDRGWANRDGMPPIKEAYKKDEYERRVELVKDEAKALEKIRGSGGLHVEWLQVLERGRGDLDGLMRSISRITPVVEKLAERAASQLTVEAPEFDASRALGYIMRFAQALKTVTEVAHGWQQIEALANEKPTQIVGVHHELPAEMTFEEAEARIKAAAQAIDIARRKASAIDVPSEDLTVASVVAVKPAGSSGQGN